MFFDHFLIVGIIIGAAIGLGLALAMIRWPKLSFILLFASIVAGQLARISLSTDVRGGSAIIGTDLIVILIAITWIWQKISINRNQQINYPLLKPILIFLAITALSFLVGLSTLVQVNSFDLKSIILSFSYLFRFAAYVALYFMARDFISISEKNRDFLISIIFLTGILVSIGGFIQLIFVPDFTSFAHYYGWDPHEDRLLGTFFDPNFIGTYLAFILALGFGLFPSGTKKQKWLIAIAVLFCAVALLLTFSRTGYLAFLFAFLIIGILRSPKILIVGLTCITLALLSSPRAMQRVTDGLSLDETGLKRIYSWDKGIRIVANFPVLGIGYNNLAPVQDFYALVDEFDVNNRGGLENSFLTILVTTGILGGITYIWLWGATIKRALQLWFRKKLPFKMRNEGLTIATALLSLVISSLFMNSLLYPFILVHIWLVSALIPIVKPTHATATH